MQKTSACPSLVVSCPQFDLAHNKGHCKGTKGDFLWLGNQRFEAILITPANWLLFVGFPGSVRTTAETTSARVETDWRWPSAQTEQWRARAQSAPLPAPILLQLWTRLQVFVLSQGPGMRCVILPNCLSHVIYRAFAFHLMKELWMLSSVTLNC